MYIWGGKYYLQKQKWKTSRTRTWNPTLLLNGRICKPLRSTCCRKCLHSLISMSGAQYIIILDVFQKLDGLWFWIFTWQSCLSEKFMLTNFDFRVVIGALKEENVSGLSSENGKNDFFTFWSKAVERNALLKNFKIYFVWHRRRLRVLLWRYKKGFLISFSTGYCPFHF